MTLIPGVRARLCRRAVDRGRRRWASRSRERRTFARKTRKKKTPRGGNVAAAVVAVVDDDGVDKWRPEITVDEDKKNSSGPIQGERRF